VGTIARAGIVLAPSGANNEGYPSSAPANGPSEEVVPGSKPVAHKDGENNHLHVNQYPNVTGPGQADVCEAGNETYVPKQPEIGNLPSSDVTDNREITSREDDLFDEKYPAPTLKALGLAKTAKAKSATKAKAKTKGKGK